jgi:hypothetical protein
MFKKVINALLYARRHSFYNSVWMLSGARWDDTALGRNCDSVDSCGFGSESTRRGMGGREKEEKGFNAEV